MRVDALRQAASHGSVLFNGDGGDPVLYPSSGYFVTLAKQRRFGRMVSDVWDYWCMYRQLPPLYFGKYLRQKLGIRETGDTNESLPAWLHRAFVERCQLQSRWDRAQQQSPSAHPTRPEAYDSLSVSFWPHRFTNLDPGVTQIPLETRYPFFDLRLISFLLRVPPMPWFAQKHILRSAMKTTLPEQVRARAKASFPSTQEDLPTREQITTWANDVEQTPTLASWVDVSAYRRLADLLSTAEPDTADSFFRPPSLARWLQSITR